MDDHLSILTQIRAILIHRLGSQSAADAWLNSTGTGYPTTAMETIRAGMGDLVLDDVERMGGPGAAYA